MKKALKVFGFIALVAVIGFSMVACGGDDGGSGNDAIKGTWMNPNNGMIVNISGSSGTIRNWGSQSDLWKNAVTKGIVKIGDKYWRGIKSDGGNAWKGEILEITYGSSNIDATGTKYSPCSFSLTYDGRLMVSASTTSYWSKQY